MMDGPCFYCLKQKVSIAICINCRTNLEKVKQEADNWKKQAEGYRKMYFKLVKERRK